VSVLFSPYKVTRKVRESEVIMSFDLVPEDGRTVGRFKAGQYLTLRLPGDLTRTYTVSSSPETSDHYRISVKKETLGRASGFLHDIVNEGDVLEILEPRGDFHLHENRSEPVVLLSGGVGVTPMISMLHALRDTDRKVIFVHACESGSVHAFRAEVDELVQQNDRLRAFYLYRTPTDDDRYRGAFHSEGVVTTDILRALFAETLPDCYLCGPPGFMKAVWDSLRQLGLPSSQIFYEFFGPSTLLEEPAAGVVEGLATVDSGSPVVHFSRSGKSVEWGNFQGSILEFAEKHGARPDSSCRVGVCNTCQCKVVSGAVSYIEEPLEMPPSGFALLCVSRPTSEELVLDL
jgi:ferredoxin-NADP reductase